MSTIQFKALLTSIVLLGIVSTTGCSGAPGEESDEIEVTPQAAQNSALAIDGVPVGNVTGIDGLGIENEIIEYQDGPDFRSGKTARTPATGKRADE